MRYDLKAGYFAMPELHERAIASLRKAIELRPTLAEAWRELSAPLRALGRDEEAIEALEKALALDPGDAEAYSALGRLHFIGRGDFARGAEAYEKALTLNPQAGWSAMQLAALRGAPPRLRPRRGRRAGGRWCPRRSSSPARRGW